MSSRLREFEILEEGCRFATISAISPEAALRRAERDYPRHRCDYNLDADADPYEIEWVAVEPATGRMVARRSVTVGEDE